jgi:transcriptional regulator with XRE-family HTH domain
LELRREAGLNQRQLATRLKQKRNLMLGERRLDVVEFYWICKARGSTRRWSPEADEKTSENSGSECMKYHSHSFTSSPLTSLSHTSDDSDNVALAAPATR